MNFVLALFVVLGFAATLAYLDLRDYARAAGNRSRDSLEVFRNHSISDREKEEALQQQSGQLFRLLGILMGGSVLPLGAVWLLGQVGVGSFWGTIDAVERVDFLVGVTTLGLLGYLAFRYLYGPS